MNDSNNHIDLEKVLEINEFIKSIDSLAFYIKLNALNALFLAIRSGEQLRGYIVVTDEFNRFSEELMAFVNSLLGIIHDVVFLISEQMKQTHRLKLYERIMNEGNMESMLVIRQFINNHGLNIANLSEKIKMDYGTISSTLLRNEKLILKGNMLAMQAKIEGAYSKSSREVFMDVAENFQKHIGQIQESLKSLKKMVNKRN
jgi:methyl-accepting chemotaxis protein